MYACIFYINRAAGKAKEDRRSVLDPLRIWELDVVVYASHPSVQEAEAKG